MSQLKMSLEEKCRELRERLAAQGEPPLLRDLQHVLDKQKQESPSICGSSETQTPRSGQQTPPNIHDEKPTPRTTNQYLITPNELSDHDSVASSLVSTPRSLPSREDDEKATLRMMKQLQASLEKKRSQLQQ